jgi:hypothetical protein
MFVFNLAVAASSLVMAWIIIVMAIKGWAVQRRMWDLRVFVESFTGHAISAFFVLRSFFVSLHQLWFGQLYRVEDNYTFGLFAALILFSSLVV